MEDVIVAIATTVGISALNVIKLSGKDSIKVVNKIFLGKDLTKVDGNTINYGYIVDDKEKIDEVLVSVFLSPKTYTKENVVEINSHGGYAATNKILELCLLNGARLAQPGEFLKRAFLNGRIDLIEAESISDLINSKTQYSRKLSMSGLEGKLSKLIKNIRKEIITILASIEVNIDYPEYEDEEILTNKLIETKCNKIQEDIESLLSTAKDGKIIKKGITVGLVGAPNVGKSSILNALLEENKAIVTDIPGTTRDKVEGTIILKGIEVHLIDTAGIRETTDKVELIGVSKSYETIENADVLLNIYDSSRQTTKEDIKILSTLDKKKTIIVLNKKDLPLKFNKEILKNFKVIEVSALNNENIEEIKNLIISNFNIENIEKDFTLLSNARHIASMKQALNIVKDINKDIKKSTPIDLIEISLKNLLYVLSEITGENYNAEILDEIFSKFCLGK